MTTQVAAETRSTPAARPPWVDGQLRLRRLLDAWIAEEIDRYDRAGFAALFGGKSGHALDEAGGFTRSFAGAYMLSGDARVPAFLKQFRDDWTAAVGASGHMYHGYDANENGDYITHTAEPFTQFLLNVLFLDPADERTIALVADAAEHLANRHHGVQEFYDRDRHVFRSYFLGTRSPYHRPPYDFQTPRHFRVLQIALAAYEATGDRGYLDLCTDYCGFWLDAVHAADSDLDVPTTLFLVAPDELDAHLADPAFRESYRYRDYYGSYAKAVAALKRPEDGVRDGRPCIPGDPIRDMRAPYHLPHDIVSTWLEVYKHVPRPEYREAIRRIMAGWIARGADQPSQIAGMESHVGIHLPKYRDFTGDASLDAEYLRRWPYGPCAYLIAGEPDRLIGVAEIAEATFAQALLRNSGRWGAAHATTHACNRLSNAGTSSADVAPALFLPVFGGLTVHFGRAPHANVLYHADGRIGLPDDVAALFIPAIDRGRPGTVLYNAGSRSATVGVRRVVPGSPEILPLVGPPPSDHVEVKIAPGEERRVEF